ncbi:MAG: Maf family nucleotide pyrophosphatase [Pseudomonadota bacterium]
MSQDCIQGPYVATCPIILASGSPRRKDFLIELGLDFTIVLPDDAVEPKPVAGESPADYVCRAAEAKAMAVAQSLKGNQDGPSPLIIAADTVVALKDEIMGKPQSDDDALGMLSRLAGQSHAVISAVCLVLPDGGMHTFYANTKVTMWDVPRDALAAYVATGEPRDKAGSYAIQGIGAFLVRAIEGSWTNVVGLPVAELVVYLREQGLIEASK